MTLVEDAPVRSSHSEWAVETHGLTKRFGPQVAVDDVELLVPRGSAFGYLGPNGAGKTTLIRTLLGLTHADSGTMSLLGVPVPRHRAQALARVGAIVDEPRFHGHISGRQNLQLLAAARGGGADERIGPSLERVRLAERADDKVRSYSMGMRQRLGVAACLIGDPELLILDEPMNGLDPAGMHEMRDMIDSLVAEGRTVMLSSHLLDEVQRTCHAVAIVDRGRVIRQGPITELLRSANAVVRVECADPGAAASLLSLSGLVEKTDTARPGVLSVTLRVGSTRDTVAELNRRLVEGGVAVYGLQEVQTSLEDWFLSVTSRLGEPES
jgi:ABC-2 type transport system ATP-binding protein